MLIVEVVEVFVNTAMCGTDVTLQTVVAVIFVGIAHLDRS